MKERNEERDPVIRAGIAGPEQDGDPLGGALTTLDAIAAGSAANGVSIGSSAGDLMVAAMWQIAANQRGNRSRRDD